MRKRILILVAFLLVLPIGSAMAQEQSSGPFYVSPPVVPTLTPAVRDLPDAVENPNAIGLEMKRREDFGFIPIDYPHPPQVDSLLNLQKSESAGPRSEAFSALIHNYAGQASTSSPPDTTGDVGPAYYLQATNQAVSTVRVITKSTGASAKTFTLQSLASTSPCNSGFCDPIVLYDRTADRWLVSELPSSTGDVCVYVSQTNDPTGAWYAYTFAIESSTDYPKYGVWPQNGNGGSYLVGVNASSTSGKWDLCAFDRAKMLAGQPATYQRFSVTGLANSGFQLVLPAHMQGNVPPPDGESAVFIRPHDDEAEDGASTPSYDLLDMWTLSVNWTTPASSLLTTLTPLHIADYDMTLCGMGTTWNCMPQPGTTQKIDPIREPLHWPLQYRNFVDHQTLVGCFVEDMDGTDHAALRWFEVRKTGAGAWTLYQEGVIGGEANVHRSVGSIAMDNSGNMAIGYTRTGTASPYYPSIYYKGRLSTDTLGTMPQGEYVIQDGAYSKTGDERWGDYAGMASDPSDDCTFWFTTEYMTSNANCGTRVAAFKFDQCGCAAVTAGAAANGDNRIDVTWSDSPTARVSRYWVKRSTTAGGPYTQVAEVADTSPGVGGGASYLWSDTTVSGGTTYYYVVIANDGGICTSPPSNEVSAPATGACTLGPTFAGLTSVTNSAVAACSLDLAWSAATPNCGTSVTYEVYRSTSSPFTPGPSSLIATGITGTAFRDSAALSSGLTYYYIVRATDTSNSAEDDNAVIRSGAPTGIVTTSTLLSENWDSVTPPALPSGWSTALVTSGGGTNGAWATHAGTVNPAGGGTHSSPNLVYFNSHSARVGRQTRLYRSSGISLTGRTSAALTFWMYHDTGSAAADKVQAQYSTDGSTWNNAGTSVNRNDGSSGWKLHTIDLSPAVGYASVRIGFLGTSAKGNDCHIDDVTLTATTAANCTPGSAVGSVKPVPDGKWITGTAAKAAKSTGSTDGSSVDISWDASTCTDTSYNLYYGYGSQVATCALQSGVCGLGNTGSKPGVAIPAVPGGEAYLWWVIVGTDGSSLESSWGKNSAGNERHPAASNQCGFNGKSTATACP